MSRRKGRVELREYAGMARRIIRAYGARFAEEGDEVELRELAELRVALNEAMLEALTHMRARGTDVSWARLGRAMGMTGEGARQVWLRNRRDAA